MGSETKRIVLALKLAGEPGRRKLDSFFRYMAEHQFNWRFQFARLCEDFSTEFVNSFRERGIDGVVYSLPIDNSGASALAEIDIPTVALDVFDRNQLRGRVRNIVYIASSCEEVGREAARHFLSQGLYRSYAFVPDLTGRAWGRLRGEAFAAEMKKNGFKVAVYRTRGRGYDLPKLRAWLERLPRPAGVFAAFDDRAVQVLEACSDAGLNVPHDVAVIGVDNDELICPRTPPPLTSIQPDHERIGELAAEKLNEMLEGRRLSKPEYISVGVKRIEVRESTSPVTQSGKLDQRALAFIQAHYAESIRPQDVVKELKVSRRLADLRFSEIQGESIGKAILRTRLEAARRLLVTTNNTLGSIANSCAFRKLERLNAAFKRQYGMSMTAYRANQK